MHTGRVQLDDTVLVRETGVPDRHIVRVQFLDLDPLDAGIEGINTLFEEFTGPADPSQPVGGRDGRVSTGRSQVNSRESAGRAGNECGSGGEAGGSTKEGTTGQGTGHGDLAVACEGFRI